jgi:hypothetical protein
MLKLIAFALLGALACYQICVSVLIFRADEYDHKQQRLQILIVWLLPLIGALGCHFFMRSQRSPSHFRDHSFVPQEPNGEAGSDGAAH